MVILEARSGETLAHGDNAYNSSIVILVGRLQTWDNRCDQLAVRQYIYTDDPYHAQDQNLHVGMIMHDDPLPCTRSKPARGHDHARASIHRVKNKIQDIFQILYF